MSKRTLIIAQDVDQDLLGEVAAAAPQWKIISGRNEEIWTGHLKEAEIIAGWKNAMEGPALGENSKLRWVQSWSAGVNSFPLNGFNERNITLTTASGVHAFPISETIFALMLGLTRKIHTYVKNQEKKKWHHSGMKLEIHGKTAGIIGTGAIGRETAKIAKAFGMKTIGVRHSGTPLEYFDEMYKSNELNKVLPLLDYVILTLPLTKATTHLFGKGQFDKMKPGSFLINIGRGETIVEDELAEALKEGKLAGAGLDVFSTEPLPVDSPLWDMENVIITPHTAGSTEHYTERLIRDIFLPNLKAYLQDGSPEINVVDYDKGY